jgi:hypothetical protein
MSIFDKYNLHYGDERKTVIDIKSIKSVSDEESRYDYFELNNIIEHSLGFDTRGCEKNLVKLGFSIPKRYYNEEEFKYCDYWHYQLEAAFRREVRNDSANSIYVGTEKGIDYKKLKRQPNDWQRMILEKWNTLLHPLADEQGWIKIVIWW